MKLNEYTLIFHSIEHCKQVLDPQAMVMQLKQELKDTLTKERNWKYDVVRSNHEFDEYEVNKKNVLWSILNSAKMEKEPHVQFSISFKVMDSELINEVIIRRGGFFNKLKENGLTQDKSSIDKQLFFNNKMGIYNGNLLNKVTKIVEQSIDNLNNEGKDNKCIGF